MYTGVPLTTVFHYLDTCGSRFRTAEAFLELDNGEYLTVRAGGPGIHSLPAGLPGPYTSYEVLMDEPPARFWQRYGQQDDGVLYAEVPRLLIAHHAVRRGGVAKVSYEVREPLSGTFTVSVLSATDAMATSKDAGESLWLALEGISEITLVGRHFVAQE